MLGRHICLILALGIYSVAHAEQEPDESAFVHSKATFIELCDTSCDAETRHENAVLVSSYERLIEQIELFTARPLSSNGAILLEAMSLMELAKARQSLSSLEDLMRAKQLLEARMPSMSPEEAAMSQAILGHLYDSCPPPPISFGDQARALAHLKSAIRTNPDGLFPNYFYGDYLISHNRPSDALPYLLKTLNAPAPGRLLGTENFVTKESRALLRSALAHQLNTLNASN